MTKRRPTWRQEAFSCWYFSSQFLGYWPNAFDQRMWEALFNEVMNVKRR